MNKSNSIILANSMTWVWHKSDFVSSKGSANVRIFCWFPQFPLAYKHKLPLPVNCVWWTFYDTWSILRPQMCLRELYKVAQLNCSRIIQSITKLYLRGLYRVTQSNTVSCSWEGYTRLTEHCPTGKERWRSVMVNLTYIKEEVIHSC